VLTLSISKTSWLLLSVGISIIAFTSLGVARSQQVHEQDQLDEELSLAERRLNGLQFEQLYSQQEELEKQLSQIISRLETTKARLSRPTGSIAASDALFSIAKACGVEVAEISSSGPASGDLEGVVCSVLPLTARIEGDVPNLISFIIKLNGDFTTGVVKSAGISVSENVSEERTSANIRLVIYTYQGD